MVAHVDDAHVHTQLLDRLLRHREAEQARPHNDQIRVFVVLGRHIRFLSPWLLCYAEQSHPHCAVRCPRAYEW